MTMQFRIAALTPLTVFGKILIAWVSSFLSALWEQHGITLKLHNSLVWGLPVPHTVKIPPKKTLFKSMILRGEPRCSTVTPLHTQKIVLKC